MAKKRKASSKVSSRVPSHLIGSWSFLVGIILAVILGLGYAGAFHATMVWVVFLLGIVVGLLNVTHGEADHFVRGGTILVLVSFLGVQIGVFKFVAPVIANILKSILTLFVPATLIVVLKSLFSISRN
ncbi:hypothetical protein HOD05_05000 [Candidatus Woesearchaeota archaeon]|nr:hypothetical protein [Candidatus Woesearchaeota archaeon]MBT4150398.1 hypothetical protein [Candidatus Woesearchaeota archaeon]MBT4247398.1 hypothetical protein [Candidatus Woesearchaeota archaeon]MBT4434547.1 hypothetical protein [Candidatus Woesearchaeota archaeon]MBT7332014.1 hypothetical protein [Candidatus Woesearchaeota archaeon]